MYHKTPKKKKWDQGVALDVIKKALEHEIQTGVRANGILIHMLYISKQVIVNKCS